MKTPACVLLSLLVLVPQLRSQQAEQRPAPIFRITRGVAPAPFPDFEPEPEPESSSAYSQPPSESFLPSAPMPQRRMPRRPPFRHCGPCGAGYGYYPQPDPAPGLIAGLVITTFFIVLFAAGHS